MAILKIKDKGVWKEIQAIKGDTGHDVYVGDKSKAPSEAKLIIEPVKGTATGTDIQVTDSVNDRVSKLVLDGKSTQETRSGKNLIELKKGYTLTQNGVTFKVNDDYSITLNGTCNKNNTLFFLIPGVVIPSDGEYTLSSKFVRGSISNTTNFTQIQIERSSDWAGIKLKLNNEDGSKTSQISADKYNYSSIRIDNNVALSNYTIKIQLEEGSVATDYEPYGVMPSPDYPSEIENVKGRNIFDSSTFKIGNIIGTDLTTRVCSYQKIYLDAGTYTFSNNLSSNFRYDITINSVGNAPLSSHPTYSYNSGWKSNASTFTFTINKGGYLTILLSKPENADITLSEINGFEYQLEKGSTVTRYIPYGNIQIVETGKNLLNLPNSTNTNVGMTVSIIDNKVSFIGTPTRAYANSNSLPFSLKAGTYSFSNTNNNYHFYLWLKNSSNTTIGNIHLYRNNPTQTINLNEEVTAVQIGVELTVGTQYNIDAYFQLEKGSTATDYEPYTEQVVNIDLKGNELCSLPNGTKDELIVKDGRAKIVKRIGKVVLDGSDDENWGAYSEKNDYFFYSNNILKTTNQYVDGFCSHFINSKVYPPKAGYFAFRNKGDVIYFRINGINTVADWRTWLSTHNTIVYYALAEPYEIDLGEVSTLTTYEGTSNITNSEDTNMSIEYDTNKTNLYYQNNGNIIKMNKRS